METNKNKLNEKMIRPESYHRLYTVRALEPGEENKMIIEGKAVTFGEETKLFSYAGRDVCEVVDKNAFDGADMSDVFLKYNHSDDIMVLARTKSKTLQLEVRDDGLYIKAELANTTAGRDLFELCKRGDIDKMSFAFSIEEETETDTDTKELYTVTKIRKLYDVAAVPLPAYENTSIYARRLGDVETRREQVETRNRELLLARKKAGLN